MTNTLQYRKNVTLEGECVVDGIVVEGYRGVIDSKNPDKVEFSSWPGDQAKYRECVDTADVDRKTFRNMVYAIQDEMKAEAAAVKAE